MVLQFFQPSLSGLALPAFRTRHWDVIARRLATPVRRAGLFSFAANAARSLYAQKLPSRPSDLFFTKLKWNFYAGLVITVPIRGFTAWSGAAPGQPALQW